MHISVSPRPFIVGVAGAAALTLTACSATSPGAEPSSSAPGEKAPVTVIVHNSFPNEEFAAAASAATGYDVTVVSAGDGGELSAQLVLTAAAPVADVFFGIDNVFAARLIDNDVVAPYAPTEPLAARVAELAAELGGTDTALPMVPIDVGATCMNIDPQWFTDNGVPAPTSYEDLVDEQYRGLTVLLDPTTSSTGASFLIGTVAAFGEEGAADYWQQLVANDARLEQGWSDAYYGQFTQGGDTGTFPIVLSYSSSPAWTLTDDGSESTTTALLDTCSTQVEYAGVLKGAANPEGAQAVLDFMLSGAFQDTIADSMYMYPADETAYVPEDWQRFAPLPTDAHDLTPAEISDGLDGWLKAWSAATGW